MTWTDEDETGFQRLKASERAASLDADGIRRRVAEESARRDAALSRAYADEWRLMGMYLCLRSEGRHGKAADAAKAWQAAMEHRWWLEVRVGLREAP